MANRVEKIRRFSKPSQWNYIFTDLNPADVGSRGVSPSDLKKGYWLSGPHFLYKRSVTVPEVFPIIDPDQDKEVRPVVNIYVTAFQVFELLGSHV